MKNLNYDIIVVVVFISIFIFFYRKDHFRQPCALEIDAIKDQTDISGTFYRAKVTNIGINQLTGIEVYLGKNDVQYLKELESGQ